MAAPAEAAWPLLARARAEEVAMLYRSWHRTTASMALGAIILCTVLWDQESIVAMSTWFAAILANQAWRGVLARAYRKKAPGVDAAPRWGSYWAVGSTLAGALWGVAAIAMFPASQAHQALLIVCIFSVILGGLNLTAVYTPAFVGFTLAALLPLIARVAFEGGQVHLFTAIVLLVVLAFLLGFGRQLNELLTRSLAMRYENVDLIDGLKVKTELAESARSVAETANRAKSQFLAAASHDLRQPLHAMGLFAAALSARTRDPEVSPLVANIHASVEALEALFAQLLDLSRLEAGALHPQRAAVALDPLIARICADFAPQARARGLALRAVRSSAVVVTDPGLLERILRNLVSNALRYTNDGGIVVGARRSGRTLRIDVIDTGIGIAAADQCRIFDEFVQIAPAPDRHAAGRGMGLGLAIVRRLCVLLDHPIEVTSVPGRGSRFSVSVALAARSRKYARASIAALPEPALPAATSSFAGYRVVVVDDDPAVVAAMEVLFNSWGAQVAGGASAADALAILGGSDADLIVADLRLQDGDSGIDAVRAIRETVGNAVPALIVSGDTSELAQSEAQASGITLLRKPLVARSLRAAAECAMSGGLSARHAAQVEPARAIHPGT